MLFVFCAPVFRRSHCPARHLQRFFFFLQEVVFKCFGTGGYFWLCDKADAANHPERFFWERISYLYSFQMNRSIQSACNMAKSPATLLCSTDEHYGLLNLVQCGAQNPIWFSWERVDSLIPGVDSTQCSHKQNLISWPISVGLCAKSLNCRLAFGVGRRVSLLIRHIEMSLIQSRGLRTVERVFFFFFWLRLFTSF